MWFLPLYGRRSAIAPVTFPVVETWNAAPDLLNSMNGDKIWTPYIGTNQWKVESHGIVLENSGNAAQGGRLELDLGTSDYRVSASVIGFTHPGTGTLVNSVAARMQGDASFTFYALDLLAQSGAYSLLLLKYVAGVFGSIWTMPIGTPVGTSNLELEVTGTPTATLKSRYNGALVNTSTDSSIPTGTFAGIQGVANGVGNRTQVDTFTVSLPTSVSGGRRRAFYGLAPLTGVR